MQSKALISIFQATIIILCGIGIYNFVVQSDSDDSEIMITDSSGQTTIPMNLKTRGNNKYLRRYSYAYAGYNESVIVGVSGDFSDEFGRNFQKPMISILRIRRLILKQFWTPIQISISYLQIMNG